MPKWLRVSNQRPVERTVGRGELSVGGWSMASCGEAFYNSDRFLTRRCSSRGGVPFKDVPYRAVLRRDGGQFDEDWIGLMLVWSGGLGA